MMWNPLVRFQFMFFLLLFSLAGYVYGQEANLGASDEYLNSPRDYGFIEWGLAKNASYNIIKNKAKVKGSQLVFSRKSKRVEWYGVLAQKGAWKNVISVKGFSIEWISPQGVTAFQEDVKPTVSMMVSSKLDISNLEPGVWIVRVLKGDRLIDERRFKIV